MSAPEASVVVPAHGRALRLRWLLNALEDQTLDAERFEAIVVHDGTDAGIAGALRDHPEVREVRVGRGTGTAPVQRNAGWRAAAAPLVVFTDDDCRPPREWLERALAAARANPGAIVQGAVRPDPDEEALVQRAPHARTLTVEPPSAWGQTANIAYPREVLERAGGFDETLPAVDDTDLEQRALGAGARLVAAPDAVTFHAVHAAGLGALLRSLWRWQHVPAVVKRHPHLREGMPLRIFWKERHASFLLAVGGALLAPRRPAALVLALPWVRAALPAYGASARGRARAASELPGRALADGTEVLALARGSLRHRTILL